MYWGGNEKIIATQKNKTFIFVKAKVSKNDLEIDNESKEIGEKEKLFFYLYAAHFFYIFSHYERDGKIYAQHARFSHDVHGANVKI